MILYLLCVFAVSSSANPVPGPIIINQPDLKIYGEIDDLPVPPVTIAACLKKEMAHSIKNKDMLYDNCVVERKTTTSNNVCFTLNCPQECTDDTGNTHPRGSEWQESKTLTHCRCGDAAEYVYDANSREIFGVPFPAYKACMAQGAASKVSTHEQYYEPLPTEEPLLLATAPIPSKAPGHVSRSPVTGGVSVTKVSTSEPPEAEYACIARDLALQMLATDTLYSSCSVEELVQADEEDCFSISCPQECFDDEGKVRAKGETWLEANSTSCECGHPGRFIYNANSREMPGISFPVYKACRVEGEGTAINGSVPYDNPLNTDAIAPAISNTTMPIEIINLGEVDSSNKYPPTDLNMIKPPDPIEEMCPSRKMMGQMIKDEPLYSTCSIYAVKGTNCFSISCPQVCKDHNGKQHNRGDKWREPGIKLCECSEPGRFIYNANSREIPGFPFPAYKACQIEGCQIDNKVISVGQRIKQSDDQKCECRENKKWEKQLESRPDLILQDSPSQYHLYCYLPGCRHPVTKQFLSPGSRFMTTSNMGSNKVNDTKVNDTKTNRCTCTLASPIENPWTSYDKQPYIIICNETQRLYL